MFFEDLIRLRIFFRKWTADDAVVLQETVDIHCANLSASLAYPPIGHVAPLDF